MLARLYCLADGFMMEELQNAVMDRIMHWHAVNEADTTASSQITELGIGDCKLRDFLVKRAASGIVLRKEFMMEHGEGDDFITTRVMRQMADYDSEDAERILRKLWYMEIHLGRPNPVTDPRCSHHTHATTEACAKGIERTRRIKTGVLARLSV